MGSKETYHSRPGQQTRMGPVVSSEDAMQPTASQSFGSAPSSSAPRQGWAPGRSAPTTGSGTQAQSRTTCVPEGARVGSQRSGEQVQRDDQQRLRSGVRPSVLPVQTVSRKEDADQAGGRQRGTHPWHHAPLSIHGGCFRHV